MTVLGCGTCGPKLTVPLSRVAFADHAYQQFGNGPGSFGVLREPGTFALDPAPPGAVLLDPGDVRGAVFDPARAGVAFFVVPAPDVAEFRPQQDLINLDVREFERHLSMEPGTPIVGSGPLTQRDRRRRQCAPSY